MLFHLRLHRPGLDVAGHDHHEVVRHVARLVVGDELLARDGRENVFVTNNRILVGMLAESRVEQRLAQTVVRIVVAHGDLAQDHVLLAGHFFDGQRRVQHRVGQHIERDIHMRRGQVDVVNRAVKRGVGVDVAAMRLHRG